MSEINLDDYYSAGYFLIRKATAPPWLNNPEKLVPREIISLETEFCPQFNWTWGSDVDRKDDALSFGISEAKWDEFEKWCRDHLNKDIDIWTMFYSPTAAQLFIHEFIPKSTWDGLMLIGAGLHRSCFHYWFGPLEPLEQGVIPRIQQRLPMETSGRILGFDVSGYAHHNFDHTWLSHHHHQGVFKEHGIRPDGYGLLATREEALLARDYTIAHDGYDDYEYWLLVSYPLEIQATE